VKYQFIRRHEGEFRVARMCEVFGVNRSGYYAWRGRKPSARAEADERLSERIRQVHEQSGQRYGSPRVRAALRQQGQRVSSKRVARLMAAQGLAGRRPKRRQPRTTVQQPGAPVAPNLLRRDFSASAPDRKWVADISYVETLEGWLYLAVVLDLFSRRVVGWAMETHLQAELVTTALEMAYCQRQPGPELILHSDRGSQYSSAEHRRLLARHQVQASMSRTGNCLDNAVVESFFSSLKAECAHRPFESLQEARLALFRYIEGFYNRERLHSSLGYLSPCQFESQALP
jgi:transposase InsO family protein